MMITLTLFFFIARLFSPSRWKWGTMPKTFEHNLSCEQMMVFQITLRFCLEVRLTSLESSLGKNTFSSSQGHWSSKALKFLFGCNLANFRSICFCFSKLYQKRDRIYGCGIRTSNLKSFNEGLVGVWSFPEWWPMIAAPIKPLFIPSTGQEKRIISQTLSFLGQ